jgi:hypothetical protein
MNVDDAPETEDEENEGGIEGCDGTYVEYENDVICNECGHVRGTGTDKDAMNYRERHLPDRWLEYERERAKEQYNGFHGENRVKFVGGFAAPYLYD